jgi:23S rRNA (adenine-N6)-dimethyltransferase
VIEIGAGRGILTIELARAAEHVIAVELDPALAIALIKRFSKEPNVLILVGDFFDVPLPCRRFRVFGSIPFGSTTRLLHHLLDLPTAGIARADLVVERGVAIKHAASRHGSLLNRCWAPWWEFSMGPRIAARSFKPQPSVDAAMLTITRRNAPLLPETARPDFVRFVRGAFERSAVRSAMRPFLSSRRLKVLARELGISPGARPAQLNAQQWTGLYTAIRADRSC